LKLGQAALALVKDGDTNMTPASAARMLALAEKSFGAAREVLAMRGHYFTDIVQYGVERPDRWPSLWNRAMTRCNLCHIALYASR
jgi:hypothetical protein